MTSVRQRSPNATSTRHDGRLRGNCMGAGVLLIIQFALGAAVSLYVSLPAHKAFFPAVFGSALVAAHAIVAVLVLAAGVSALVRAIRARNAVVFTSVGLAAIVYAGAAGVAFVLFGTTGASLGMALASAVAMFCYFAAVFRLR